jgi:hypothetical protein
METSSDRQHHALKPYRNKHQCCKKKQIIKTPVSAQNLPNSQQQQHQQSRSHRPKSFGGAEADGEATDRTATCAAYNHMAPCLSVSSTPPAEHPQHSAAIPNLHHQHQQQPRQQAIDQLMPAQPLQPAHPAEALADCVHVMGGPI